MSAGPRVPGFRQPRCSLRPGIAPSPVLSPAPEARRGPQLPTPSSRDLEQKEELFSELSGALSLEEGLALSLLLLFLLATPWLLGVLEWDLWGSPDLL